MSYNLVRLLDLTLFPIDLYVIQSCYTGYLLFILYLSLRNFPTFGNF